MSARPLLRCPDCSRDLPPRSLECACGGRIECVEGWLSVLPREFEPEGFPATRRAALGTLEQRHFWFAPRDRLLVRIARRIVGRDAARVVELGCGSGRLLEALRMADGPVVGVDGHAASLREAAARDTKAALVHARVTDTPLASSQFDLVTAFDVLEHVEPGAFLAEAQRIARPGARLLLSVPASPRLWSEADRIAGHRCRYSLETLRAELVEAGWRFDGHTHYQAILFPLMLLSRKAAPRAMRATERAPPRALSALLGAINAFEVEISSRVTLPFGSSLVAWARR